MELSEATNYIVDLRKIYELSAQNNSANLQFAAFLKTQNAEVINRQVQEIYYEVAAQIDCQKCGNCCKALTVALDYPSIARLAEGQNLTSQEFKKKYMFRDSEGDMVIKQRPCPFLKSHGQNNTCSVYESRPDVCRKFPHLDRGDFMNRIGKVLTHLQICPIAFNVFDLLKLRYE